MAFLAYLTEGLKAFAPASYGVAFVFGVVSVFCVMRIMVSIYIGISQRVTTKKKTYIDYKMENGRIVLVGKSNIYKEPSVTLNVLMAPEAPSTPLIANNQRNANRLAKKNPAVLKETGKTASILVLFEKPVASETFHIRVESGVGKCPTREMSSMDNRWASIAISHLEDECSFRICFN